ncbi:hypothetical protein MKX03_019195 [Papaver bracteatum]|nr:hypothetical protein MKX03_019195 [Papaver bracteatum]
MESVISRDGTRELILRKSNNGMSPKSLLWLKSTLTKLEKDEKLKLWSNFSSKKGGENQYGSQGLISISKDQQLLLLLPVIVFSEYLKQMHQHL